MKTLPESAERIAGSGAAKAIKLEDKTSAEIPKLVWEYAPFLGSLKCYF